ncbi:hypothetical protein GCM10022392_33160 [Mucilaginibacter panaciglaebae]|uniref:LPP20 lipoprotein n=2 Tax=Mucilaginibacter panaciglaebae TaxID=502331 RepID=A0ABP7X5U5_9SPHI
MCALTTFAQQIRLDKLGTVAVPKQMTEASRAQVNSFVQKKYNNKLPLDFMVNSASKVYFVDNILITVGYKQLPSSTNGQDYLSNFKKVEDGAHSGYPSYSSRIETINGNKFIVCTRDSYPGRCIIINGLNESTLVRFDCSLQYASEDEAKAQSLVKEVLAGVKYKVQ